MPRSIVVVGGGVAGVAAAYELARLQREGADLTFTLLEKSSRIGGIVETVRQQGFVMETGPDAWVTEKPWARELAVELGLADQIIPSNDAERVTYVLRNGRLLAMPENMRMMVPSDLRALEGNALFSDDARASYAAEPGRAEELKRSASKDDESVADFVKRHFGEEVLRVVGAPLLNGVFGGDVEKLSVQAVMQPFVKMEQDHGSLITAAQKRDAERGDRPRPATFTTLRNGMGTLIEAMSATLPPGTVRLGQSVQELAWHPEHSDANWTVSYRSGDASSPMQHQDADALLLATPVGTTSHLIAGLDSRATALVDLPASSAVTVAMGFTAASGVQWPKGFGFLAPQGEGTSLLAATFADQKFSDRAPAGARLVRAYFGGATADRLMPQQDEAIAAMARTELQRILGPLPEPAACVVRRWPQALPQYEVGHLLRMAELDRRIAAMPGLMLLGNGYRGVGVPDLIRDARAAARKAAGVVYS